MSLLPGNEEVPHYGFLCALEFTLDLLTLIIELFQIFVEMVIIEVGQFADGFQGCTIFWTI